jgi:hypothetical protein
VIADAIEQGKQKVRPEEFKAPAEEPPAEEQPPTAEPAAEAETPEEAPAEVTAE